MRKVVLAVDGTTGPHSVRSICRSLVQKPEEVVLFQARKPADAPVGQAAENMLRSQRAVEETCAARVTTVVREGACSDELLKVVEETGAELIVIGFKRLPALRRLLSGCEVRKIERRATVPVIVAQRSAKTHTNTQKSNGRVSYAA